MSGSIALAITTQGLYSETFAHFQRLFSSTTKDVSKTQLISHLSSGLYQDRALLGAALTGALMAMLDHQRKDCVAGLEIGQLPAFVHGMAPAMAHDFDAIILEQASTTGAGLSFCDVVMQRVLHWERHDYRKYKRWLRALDKAARIQNQKMAVPFSDPFRREAKEQAVEQLRPFLARLQRTLKTRTTRPKRREPAEQAKRREILEAFAQEVENSGGSFLLQNLELWLRFVESNPYSVPRSSPEGLFHEFAAFVTGHDPTYTAKQFYSQ
jgi:hypothetical protein